MTDLVLDTTRESFRDKVTVEAGVVTVDKADVDAALEANGVNVSDLRKMQKTGASVAAGIIEACGEAAIDAMVSHKDLAAVVGDFNIGHEKYTNTFVREASVPIPGKSASEAKTVLGRTRVKRKITVGGTSIKGVTDRIAALGTTKLGK